VFLNGPGSNRSRPEGLSTLRKIERTQLPFQGGCVCHDYFPSNSIIALTNAVAYSATRSNASFVCSNLKKS
jgi:hypothetical protein